MHGTIPEPSQLTLNTFGVPRISGIRASITSRAAKALLTYLSSKCGQDVARDTLATLLWDTPDIRRARHSLSQTLHSLKKLVPERCLRITSQSIGIEAAAVSCDYCRFRAAFRQKRFVDALEIYTGQYLDGFPYISDGFDDWRIGTAALLESEALAACKTLITTALEEENYQAAAEWAQKGLVIVPADDFMARVRVEALASLGDLPGALREVEVLRRLLLIETGHIPPSLSDEFVARISNLQILPDQTQAAAELWTRIIGREQEVKLLRDIYLATRLGSRVVAIRGESGVGKTRLLHHAIRRAVLDGARTYTYGCSDAESGLPYSTIAGLLRDGFRAIDLRDLDERWCTALSALAPEIVQRNTSQETATQRIIWESVVQYFAAVAATCNVVISVDDYQWIDDSSRELLTYVQRRLASESILILTAERGATPPPTYEDDKVLVNIINLEELRDDAVSALITEVERRYDLSIDASTRRLLLHSAGGIPFLLLEGMRHLRETGDVPTDPAAPIVSPSIEQYITRRIGSLSPRARSLLAAAAVMGRETPIHILAKVASIPTISAAAATDELVCQGIILDSAVVKFKHDLIKEAIARRISASERNLWHSRIAEILSEVEPTRSSEIAFHYEAAGRMLAAYPFALQAAQGASRLHAYRDAEEQFGRALRCASDSDKIIAHDEYAKHLARLGRFNELERFVPLLETHYRERLDYEGVIICEIAKYWARERQGGVRAAESLAHVSHILRLAEQHTPQHITAVMWHVADSMRRSGEYDAIARFADLLEERGRSASDRAAAAELLSTAAILEGWSRGYATATVLASRAVDIARSLNDRILQCRALFASGTAFLWAGDLRSARHAYDDVLATTDEFAPDNLLARLQSNYAVLLLEQADYTNAAKFAHVALQEVGAGRRAYVYGNLALIHLRNRDFGAANQYIDALRESHVTTPQDWIPVHSAALCGLSNLLAGDMAAATTQANEVEAQLDMAGGVVDCSHLHILRARVELGKDNISTAERILLQGIKDIAHKEWIAGARLRLELATVYARSERQLIARPIVEEILARARSGEAWSIANEAMHVGAECVSGRRKLDR
jgi:DNA-binding SARP family transcriptional activator